MRAKSPKQFAPPARLNLGFCASIQLPAAARKAFSCAPILVRTKPPSLLLTAPKYPVPSVPTPLSPPAHEPAPASHLITFSLRRAEALAAVLCAAVLAGCGPSASDAAPPSAAEVSFNDLVAACTKTIEARTFTVRSNDQGQWVKSGYSPASVTGEFTSTESKITPYLGKLVVKDNTARVSADTEAQAAATRLLPAHVLANHIYTFIFRFDGTQWVWSNGSLVTKTKTDEDVTKAMTLADVVAADGFAGCLPH